MEDETTAVKIGGTWYLRLPPIFARHCGIDTDGETTSIPFMIRDEVNKKGQKYISGWKQGD
jgi:hypothetical protein